LTSFKLHGKNHDAAFDPEATFETDAELTLVFKWEIYKGAALGSFIREVFGSNFGWNSSYTDWGFHGLP
jgi:hypothetical protein